MRFTGSIPEVQSLSAMEPAKTLEQERSRRAGIFTASRCSALITPKLAKPDNATFRQYIAEKAWERVTGVQADNSSGARATEWGHEWESMGLFEFTMSSGVAVESTGLFQSFFKKEGYPFGATPDGIVSDPIGNRSHTVEVKCPYNGGIHFQNLRNAHDKEWFKANRFDYWAQVQGSMWAADVDRCYFISFDPGVSRDSYRIPFIGFEKYRIKWTEFQRDEEFIKALAEAINRAEEELLQMI